MQGIAQQGPPLAARADEAYVVDRDPAACQRSGHFPSEQPGLADLPAAADDVHVVAPMRARYARNSPAYRAAPPICPPAISTVTVPVTRFPTHYQFAEKRTVATVNAFLRGRPGKERSTVLSRRRSRTTSQQSGAAGRSADRSGSGPAAASRACVRTGGSRAVAPTAHSSQRMGWVRSGTVHSMSAAGSQDPGAFAQHGTWGADVFQNTGRHDCVEAACGER